MSAPRAFPVLRTPRVEAVAAFYEELGFTRGTVHPPEGEPEFVALRRGGAEVAIARSADGAAGDGPWEMFVFVDDLDAVVRRVRSGAARVLQEPVRMPWGERVARVADPDGNGVALASEG
ncbi:VOC family protein [Nocardiopsis halophila]|uniref:VOC family protein n=1 Tax=Nocardiopsis halophila TaxID=141692 RepID=UPI000346C7BC|nr:VOC family protein [Nocardiopsis halophila]